MVPFFKIKGHLKKRKVKISIKIKDFTEKFIT